MVTTRSATRAMQQLQWQQEQQRQQEQQQQQQQQQQQFSRQPTPNPVPKKLEANAGPSEINADPTNDLIKPEPHSSPSSEYSSSGEGESEDEGEDEDEAMGETEADEEHEEGDDDNQNEEEEEEDDDDDDVNEDEDEDEEMMEVDEDDIIRIEPSQLEYSIQKLSSTSRDRAIKGLEDKSLEISLCGKRDSRYYAFQINDIITVRVGDEHSHYSVPRCSCGANEGGLACEHIYWLSHQLVQAVPQMPTFALELAPDGATMSNSTLFNILTSVGFEDLARHRNWLIQNEPPQDDEGELVGGEESSASEEVMSMLSVFEPSGLFPREWREMATTNHSSRVYRDFSNIITKHAVRDPGFFLQLRRAITPSFRNETYAAKLRRGAEMAFLALDEYVRRGTGGGAAAYDVVSCAKRLEAIVQETKDNFERVSGPAGGPDAPRAAQEAVHRLWYILDKVADRNYNAYEQLTWTRTPNPDETIEDVNLFQRLIGVAENPRNPMFVLSVLKDIPQTVILPHKETFVRIIEKLEGQRAPERYVDKLRDIISQPL